jgi:hypothetical protein
LLMLVCLFEVIGLKIEVILALLYLNVCNLSNLLISGMAYPGSNMTSTTGQFRSSQTVPHPSLQTMPSSTHAYPATPQYPSMNPTYLNSAAHHLHPSSNYPPPPGNPGMTMPSALTHQGAYATGAPLTSVPRGYSVGAPNAIPAGLQSSIPGGVSQVGYPAGYPVQGPYTSANLYGGGQYPGL